MGPRQVLGHLRHGAEGQHERTRRCPESASWRRAATWRPAAGWAGSWGTRRGARSSCSHRTRPPRRAAPAHACRRPPRRAAGRRDRPAARPTRGRGERAPALRLNPAALRCAPVPKSFLLSDEIHRYLIEAQHPARRRPAAADRRDGGARRHRRDAGGARTVDLPHPGHPDDRGPLGRRGGHVHRHVRHLDRRRPGPRRVASSCCDVSEEWTAVARRYWARGRRRRPDRAAARSGHRHPAGLPADGGVDLAFIDADKVGYVDYWSELVPRVRSGGVLLVDNMLQGGAVVDPDDRREQVEAIRALQRPRGCG